MTTAGEVRDALSGLDEDEVVEFHDEDGNIFDLYDSGHKDGKFIVYLRVPDDK